METFFDNSTEQVVGALLGGETRKLTDDELERIADIVEKARKEKAK
jgi:DNA-directed RNA polymerase subunit F